MRAQTSEVLNRAFRTLRQRLPKSDLNDRGSSDAIYRDSPAFPHKERRGKGSHLSAEGVALAPTIGATIGPVDLVLTSLSPRTLETAIFTGIFR